MQHDIVLKKLNFDLFTSAPKSTQRGETQALYWKSRFIYFIFIVPLSASENSVKYIDNLLLWRNLNILPFTPPKGGGVKPYLLSCLSTGTW